MADPRFLEELKAVVLQRISDDELALPPMPGVVSAARAAMRASFEPERVAHALEPDPLMAARLLRLASSPTYVGSGPVLHLPGVVTRLGQRTMAKFLDEVAATSVYSSPDAGINRVCRGYRQHLLAVATLARELVHILAGTGQEQVAEAAYLGGLMHDIGKPVLAAMLLDAERRMRASNPSLAWLSESSFAGLVNSAHRTVGLLVAAKWDFPARMRLALVDNVHYDSAEPFSVPNVVRLANGLCKRAGLVVGPVDVPVVEEVIRQGVALFKLSSARLASVCDGLAARVNDRLG